MKPILAIFVLWFAFMCVSATLLKGGQLQNEVYVYLPHYLGNQTLAEKLWDPQHTEINEDYQARELSYFFDWIDCHAIDFSARHGFANFLSVSFYTFVLVIMLVLRKWMRGIGFGEVVIFLALCVLLTCPFFMLTGSYLRSAKIGVAMCIALGLAFGGNRLILFWLALAACWFDRQGVFLVGLAGAIYGAWDLSIVLRITRVYFRYWRKYRVRTSIKNIVEGCRPSHIRFSWVPFLLAAVLAWLYNGFIDPAIIHHLQGYYPSFAYQQLPWDHLLKSPGDHIGTGVTLVENNIAQLAGGFMRPDYGLALLVLVGFGLFKSNRKHLAVFGATLAGLLVMYLLMYLRHPPIGSAGCMQDGYYWTPGCVILFAFSCIAAKRLKESSFAAILILAAAVNGYALIGHAALLDGSRTDLIQAISASARRKSPANISINKDPLYQFFVHRI